jgi:hypothetical protein
MSLQKPVENYLDYVQTVPEGELSQLQSLAEFQAAAQSKVDNLEAQLAKAREELKDLAERRVPELMDQIGMVEFKTTSGLIIKIDETIRASIPKAKAPFAFAWLRENGHAALIKRKVSVAFGKGEDESAEQLLEALSGDYEVEDDVSVHSSTLAAFVREKLRDGVDIPLDLLGVHRQRISKLDTK